MTAISQKGWADIIVAQVRKLPENEAREYVREKLETLVTEWGRAYVGKQRRNARLEIADELRAFLDEQTEIDRVLVGENP